MHQLNLSKLYTFPYFLKSSNASVFEFHIIHTGTTRRCYRLLQNGAGEFPEEEKKSRKKSVIYPRIAISNCSGESPFPYFLKRYIVPAFEFHVIHTELIKVATGCFKTEPEYFPTRNG